MRVLENSGSQVMDGSVLKNANAFILLKNVRMSGKTGRLIGPPFHRKGPIDSCWFFRSVVKMGRHSFLILCMMLEV